MIAIIVSLKTIEMKFHRFPSKVNVSFMHVKLFAQCFV